MRRALSRSMFAVMLALLSIAAIATEPAVPPALEAWRSWALHGQDFLRCPSADAAEAGDTRCRWPGELSLQIDADGARFEQSWTLQARQRVPLPGDARWRPIEVEVDGRAAPVVLSEGEPALQLDAGTHRLRGRIGWSRRPATLPVPDEIALLSLRVDGTLVAAPERNDEGELVLGATDENEADALQLEVYRLLHDGVPQLLVTRVQLSVAGRPREQVFPPLLPAGFVPVALDSELPARLDADGGLRVQLRSGGWSLTVIARAAAPMDAFQSLADAEPWPAQEIWQFRADPQFRLAQLTGVAGVDPQQVTLPDWDGDASDAAQQRWQSLLGESDSLPAYLFDVGQTATLEVALRGLPTSRPSRLSLQRELWLDFDGSGFSTRDRISGDLGGAARLDLRAPWRMERAQVDAQRGLLITSGTEEGTTGVELREAAVNLEVDTRVDRAGISTASGWTQAFDHASAVLHLPPGYRLLAATGADRASGSWWQAWNLLDLFLLCTGALLAWRTGGVPLLALALAWGVLAWHEPQAPRVSVILLLLFALLARHVREGWFGRLVRIARGLALVAVAWFGLVFAASELRMALYPQLEQAQVRGSRDVDYGYGRLGSSSNVADAVFQEAAAPVPAAPPARAKMAQAANQALEQIQVTGSRIKRSDLFSYPADAMVQNGLARPDWQWARHDISWNGPLLPDDAFGLVLSPPWMTRLWRLAAVLLLGGLLWRVLRSDRAEPRTSAGARAATASATALLFAILPATSVRAQATPDAALLEELRNRLTTPQDACRPTCGALGEVQIAANADTLVLSLQAQAQAELVWPLPRPDESLTLVALRVDGVAAPVLRDDDGDVVHLQRGVHRVEAQYRAKGERWRLAFPLAPATLTLQAEGFEAIGLDEQGLVGDTLELVPPRRSAVATGDAPAADPSEAVPPFVRVRRELILDQRWELAVQVTRIAPSASGVNLRLPLWPGEQPFHNAPPVQDGHALVSLPAGVSEVSWRSRLTPADSYALQAGDGRLYAEEWLVTVSPLLHAEIAGLPESGQDNYDGARRFLPLPAEKLAVQVTRPSAVQGARLAFEDVNLAIDPGQRARNVSLSFRLRASQAGQHLLQLPQDAELLQFGIDGREQPRVIEKGQLRLPLRAGEQQVTVQWREPVAMAARLEGPAIAMGASASNIRTTLTIPRDRWLWFTRGPMAGPAVLYWGELAVMLLAAFGLSRLGHTPLRFHHWLLLGLGFSTLSWFAAALVTVWLLVLGWRERRADLVEHRVFPWLQLGLIGLSGAALLALLVAVPYGLLSQPDMHVVGNGSSAYLLHWFADRSADGELTKVQAFTLPLWLYKLAILAWALWLANALFGWLRWAWRALGTGGWWRPIFRRKAVAPVESNPA